MTEQTSINQAHAVSLTDLVTFLDKQHGSYKCELCENSNWYVAGNTATNQPHYLIFAAFVSAAAGGGSNFDALEGGYPFLAMQCSNCGNSKLLSATTVIDKLKKDGKVL